MLLACITSHQLYYITSSLHHLDVLHHLTSEYTNRANLVYYTRCHMYYKGFTFTDEQAFRLFFHRHSGRQGCCVGLAGHAPASDSPGFARSDPRQVRAGATLCARTQRGAQEREPTPNPPENCTKARVWMNQLTGSSPPPSLELHARTRPGRRDGADTFPPRLEPLGGRETR